MPAISNFRGIVSDADPGDVPDGASQSQKNVSTTRPGALIPRQGIQPATFDSTDTISGGAFNTFQKITFCKTRLGDLIGVNGIERGFRWDGKTPNIDKLGMDAPAEGPRIEIQPVSTVGTTANEIATIVEKSGTGEYQIATTTAHGFATGDKVFLGNIQTTDDAAMAGDLNGIKHVVTVTSTTEFYIENTVHEGTYKTAEKGNWSKGSSGTLVAATATISAHQSDDELGEGATEGRYICFYRWVDRSSNPVYSAMSPDMDEVVTQKATYSFKWTNVKVPTVAEDPSGRVVGIELWRSVAGETERIQRVHVFGATADPPTALGSAGTEMAEFEDVLDDDTLNAMVGDDVMFIGSDTTLIARRQVPPPTDMAYAVMFQDRYFFFGIVKYNAGTVTVGAAATATVTITDYTEFNPGDKVNLVATDTTNYDFVNGDQSSVAGTWESTTSNDQTATNLMNVINTGSGPSGSRFFATVDGAVVTITQAAAGSAGNTTVTLTDAGTAGMSKTDFTGGGGANDVVTGTGTNWTSDMVGRYIEIDGVNDSNLKITAVDAGANPQEITISDSAAAVIDKNYVITPVRSRRRQILFSFPDEPESVPSTNSITLQENAGDDDEIVGAMPYGPYLYILSQRHKYSVSYTSNPVDDGTVRFLDDRGAFNHDCWDIFENTAYLMDDSGCYSFDGKESKTISGAIQDLWRRDGLGNKIDFSKQANFFVKTDRPKEKIYFFVSFTGDADDLPTRALVFNIRRQTFDPMQYPVQIAGAAMVEKDGETRLVFGAENEKIHLVDEGTTDMITSEVLGLGAAGSLSTTLVCNPGVFISSPAAASHVGASVYIYEGTGKGQRRTINVVDSGTQVTLRTPWTTTPDATSKFVVGAVEWNWKSTSFPIVASDDRTPRSVELKFKPTTATQSVDMRLFYNNETTVMTNEVSVNEGDAVEIRETNKSDVVFHMKKDKSSLSDSTGRETYRFSSVNSISGQGDHSLAIEFRGYAGDESQEIQEIGIDGVASVGEGDM